MISWQHDTIFIGYGRPLQCEHCKNKTVEIIEQEHTYTAMPFFYRNQYADLYCI